MHNQPNHELLLKTTRTALEARVFIYLPFLKKTLYVSVHVHVGDIRLADSVKNAGFQSLTSVPTSPREQFRLDSINLQARFTGSLVSGSINEDRAKFTDPSVTDRPWDVQNSPAC